MELRLQSQQVAVEIGAKGPIYSLWESGKRKPRPDSPVIPKLSSLFKVSKMELLKELGYMENQPYIEEGENILSLLRVIVGSSCASITRDEIDFLVELSIQVKITEELLPVLLHNRILHGDTKSPVER